MAASGDSMFNLAQHWNAVEWNVFGDCCGFQASFSGGSTIVVKTSGPKGRPPPAAQEGFSAETNNLSLVGPAAQDSTPPAIVFAQSNGGGSPASCIFAVEGGPSGKPGQHGGPSAGACGCPACRRAAGLDVSATGPGVPFSRPRGPTHRRRGTADFDSAGRACGVGGVLNRARRRSGAGAWGAAFTWAWAACRNSPRKHSANVPRKRSCTFTAQSRLGGNKLSRGCLCGGVGLECRKVRRPG